MNMFGRLKSGLSKTRSRILTTLGVRSAELSDDFFELLEEVLIGTDLGVELTTELVDRLRAEAGGGRLRNTDDAYARLKELLVEQIAVEKEPDEFPPKPWVILVTGVNGVGKTTTIGKLAAELAASGKHVMLGAADTFRAGAIEQLRIWAERTDAEFVSQHEGADPASVAYDALEAAKARNTDVLLLDTAGRLHSKTNLMNELQKVLRVIRKNTPHAPNEILLVVDATTGQNALKQAQVFNDALGVTGLVVTKLDGTAKGGVAIGIARALGIPVRKVGVGEGIDDLQDFDPRQYVEAMLGSVDGSERDAAGQ